MTSWWTSLVPSQVRTDSRLLACRMIGCSSVMPAAPRIVRDSRAMAIASRTLLSELQRYTEVYGGSVLVVDANREVVVAAGGSDTDAATDEAVTRALTGATTVPPGTAWPWRDEPMLVGSLSGATRRSSAP